LKLENLADVLFTQRSVGQISTGSGPQVVFVVVSEVANAAHLQDMCHGVEHDWYAACLELLDSILSTWLLALSGMGQPGRCPGRHHRASSNLIGESLGDPIG
jgi:hypothetical protein